jgi:RHS repeat-associated protein
MKKKAFLIILVYLFCNSLLFAEKDCRYDTVYGPNGPEYVLNCYEVLEPTDPPASNPPSTTSHPTTAPTAAATMAPTPVPTPVFDEDNPDTYPPDAIIANEEFQQAEEDVNDIPDDLTESTGKIDPLHSAAQTLLDDSNEMEGVSFIAYWGMEDPYSADMERDGIELTTLYANESYGTTGGDPVRFAAGTFYQPVTDFSYRYFDQDIKISRIYQSNRLESHSFGQGWSFNYDTRIIMGVKPLAAEEAAQFAESADQVLANYNILLDQYNTLLPDANSAYTDASEIQARTEAAVTGAWEAVTEAGKINSSQQAKTYFLTKADTLYEQAGNLKTSADTNLANADAALTALDDSYHIIEQLYQTYLDIRELAEESARELLVAESNNTKNTYVINPSDPDNLVYCGNDSIILIDEAGTPHLYFLDREPNLNSTVLYANGSINYFPAGSTCTAVRPGDNQLELLADGSYRVTNKSHIIYQYNLYGLLESITTLQGHIIHFIYSADHQLIEITDDFGRSVHLTRSGNKISKITDNQDRKWEYYYNASGQLSRTIDAVGAENVYTYDGHLLTGILKPDGSSLGYSYRELNGKMIVESTTDEEGHTEYFNYFPDQGYTEYINPAGVVEKHYYNERMLETAVEYADGSRIEFEYDNNNLTRRMDELGRITEYIYDGNRNLVKSIDPAGNWQSWTYNQFNQVLTYTDKNGNTTSNQYDAQGDLTLIQYPDGSQELFGYNESGQLTSYTDQLNNTTTYTYDDFGNMASITAPDSSVRLFTYDSLGNLLTFADQAGNVTSFVYNSDNRIIELTDPAGSKESYVYNNRKDLVRKTDKAGGVTVYRYDRRHKLIEEINPAGEVTRYSYRPDGKISESLIKGLTSWVYTYDTRGRLTAKTNPDTDTSHHYTYDPAGQLVGVTDPNGNYTEYIYNSNGQITELIDPAGGRQVFTYDAAGELAARTDEQGHTTAYTYDNMRRLIRETDALGASRSWQYDARGFSIAYTDKNNNTNHFRYDSAGRLLAAVDPAGYEEQRTYDVRGLVNSVTDKRGHTTRFVYNNLGLLTEIINPLGQTNSFTYNPKGQLISASNTNGAVTSYVYDEAGRLTTLIAPAYTEEYDSVTQYYYNTFGQLDKVTDPVGNSTFYSYDALNRLITITDPVNAVTSFTYDKNGNRLSITDAEGLTSTYAYNTIDQLISRTNPAGEAVQYNYDRTGNLVELITAAGSNYQFQYDASGRLVNEINQAGNEKHYTYDAAANLISLTDFNGVTTHYSYDVLGRLTGKTAGGETAGFVYDPVGNCISAADNDSTLVYTYNNLDQLINSHDLITDTKIDYLYDLAGNRKMELVSRGKDQQRATYYVYGPDGSLKKVTDPDGYTARYTYDLAGRLLDEIRSNNTAAFYTYTPAGLVESIRHLNTASGETLKAFYYLYDKTGKRRYQLDDKGGLAGFQYDTAGRLQETAFPFTSGRVLADFEERLNMGYYYSSDQTSPWEYTFDISDPAFDTLDMVDLKNLLKSKVDLVRIIGNLQADHSVKWQITQDSGALPFTDTLSVDNEYLGQLTDILDRTGSQVSIPVNQLSWKEVFHFDTNGNRLSKQNGWGRIDYTYNTQDQLLSAGLRQYFYDNNGNLTRESIGNTGADYVYNADNRLVDAYSEIAGLIGLYPFSRKVGTTYGYDPFGRLDFSGDYIVDSPGSAKTAIPGTGKKNLYSGFSINPVMELMFTAAGEYQMQAEYIYAGNRLINRTDFSVIDSVLAKRNKRFYSQDALNSTVMLSNPKGNILTEYDYSVAGTPYGDLFFENEERLFTGKSLDYSMGLYNYGYRFYSSLKNRFTTVDPIKDGLNWYGYCMNDPLNLVDLFGLSSLDTTVYVGYNDLSNYEFYGKELGSIARLGIGKLVNHATIVITDENNDVTDIIESGQVNELNTPITDGSYTRTRFREKELTPSNESGEWEEQFGNGVQGVPVPENMTTQEFEDTIKDVADSYTGTDKYDALPKGNGESNSNSYVGSIIRTSGVSDFKPDEYVPGWKINITSNMYTPEMEADPYSSPTGPYPEDYYNELDASTNNTDS